MKEGRNHTRPFVCAIRLEVFVYTKNENYL